VKKFCSFVFLCFLVFAGTLYLPGLVGTGLADEDIGELAPLPQPNELVVVPNEQNPNQIMYMAPGIPGLYILDGVLYRNVGGAWWMSRDYNGPWAPVVVDLVPPIFFGVPPYYADHLPRDYHRIRYDDYRRYGRSWDRAHFERQGWYRHEMQHSVREARLNHVNQQHQQVRDRERERNGVGHDQHTKGKEVAKGGKPDLRDTKGKPVADKNKNPQDRTKVTNGQQPTKGINDKKVKDPKAAVDGQKTTNKAVKGRQPGQDVAKVQQPRGQQPKAQQTKVQQPKAQQPKAQPAKAQAPKAPAKPADNKKGGK